MVDISNIPSEPGCYLFKDSSGNIIYIGKAKNLKKRVSSYFQKKDHDTKTKALVEHITSIDYVVTDNEVEALILENNLIKKHTPKYNIDLRDAKGFAYIQVTDEVYPRLLVARQRINKGEYFGPFVSGGARDVILESLITTFKIRTCKKLPKKECLRFALGLCSAPCTSKVSKEEYALDISSARRVLQGHTEDLSKEFRLTMQEASKRKNYELALKMRDRIASLEVLQERQRMERDKRYDEDFITYILSKDTVYLSVFHAKKGILIEKDEFEFPFAPDFLEQCIVQYYSDHPIPEEMIISEALSPACEAFVNRTKGSKVKVTVPIKGDKAVLLELVKKNIHSSLFAHEEKLLALQDALHLSSLPSVIECFDISHLGGTNTVASLVQFRKGKPDKQNYRRFKINAVEGIDDFASMREVVYRRYYKLVQEKTPLPDLIVIDGGLGQLSSALSSLEKIGLKIPIIGLAKREEEIFIPGSSEPIILSRKNKALHLLQNIRDEAHRFAISYNRLLTKKRIRDE